MAKAREVHLVGSIPLADTEDVFGTVAQTLGEKASRIPDGETRLRAQSCGSSARSHFFLGHPQLEIVEPDSERAGAFGPARIGLQGMYSPTMAGFYQGKARLRTGVSSCRDATAGSS
jgi:hypothetical protein